MEKANRIAAYLALHARRRESVLAEAAPYAEMTPAERAEQLDAACRLAADALRASPYRERILEHRVEPHSTYALIVQRLRRAYRGA